MTATRGRKPSSRATRSSKTSRTTPEPADDGALMRPGGTVPESEREPPIPLSSRALLWPPRHAGPSPSLVHLPFLFWVMESARPTRVVQLGLGDGVVFLSLCQAIDKLGLESLAIGVEPATDGPALSASQAEQLETHYGDRAFVVSEDLAQAARHLSGWQIDLLVLNTGVDDEVLQLLRSSWEPLLSDRALIACLQPETLITGRQARQHVDELLLGRPSISFPGASSGLDLILLGDDQPERLQRMARLAPGQPEYLAVRQVFARLGGVLEKEQSARSLDHELRQARVALKEAQDRLAPLESELESAREEVRAARSAEAEQAARVASLQVQIFDLTTARAGGKHTSQDAVQDTPDSHLRRHDGPPEEVPGTQASPDHEPQADKGGAAEVGRPQSAPQHEPATRSDNDGRTDVRTEEWHAPGAAPESVLAGARSGPERQQAARDEAHAAEVEVLTREKAALQVALSRTTAALVAKREELTTAHAAEIDALREALAEARVEHEQRQEAHAAELDALRTELATRLQEDAGKDAGAGDRLEALQAALQDAAAQVAARDARLAEMADNLERTEQAERATAAELEQLRAEIQALTAKSERLRKGRDAAEAALVEARSAAKTREAAQAEQLSASDARMRELEQTLHGMQADRDARLAEMEQELRALQAVEAELAGEADRLRQELAGRQGELHDLQQQLAQ